MAELKSKNDLIPMMESWFKKAPALPANAKDTIVKIMPWIALIFGILGVLAGLGAVGVSPVVVFGGVRNSMVVLLSGVLTIVASVMMLMAYPKMKALKMSGWNLLFWSTLISFVASLIIGSIVSAIIWGLVEFYILFQIKSYYK
ncbi:hypothetical protein BH09PAT1_BH09PAT1_1720 [soil metagenome]